MARSNLNVSILLDRIHCHDEGDGLGTAEPYLWTVFFKIDGSNVSVTDAATLAGSAFTQATPGSHGNLGNTDVDAGDDVPIPNELGIFDTTMVPIHGGVLDTLGDDLGGVMGVVCVLMEEDNVTDAGANAGHAALNAAVQGVLDQVVATRSITNTDVSDEEIAGFSEQIQEAVEDAVSAQQGFFENIWSWLNADDTVGFKVFTFRHDDLAAGGTFNFSHRWNSEGSWEIFGHVISTPQCAAASLDGLFAGAMASTTLSPEGKVLSRQAIDAGNPALLREQKAPVEPAKEGRVFDLATLRAFRDGAYRETPGLARWWRLAEHNMPAAVLSLFADVELREHTFEVMKGLPALVKNPDARVPESLLDSVAKVAGGLKAATRSRRLRIDAGRVLSAVELVRGKTFRETAVLLGSIEPARHPRYEGEVPPTKGIRVEGVSIPRRAAA